MKKLILILLASASAVFGQSNVKIVNPATQPGLFALAAQTTVTSTALEASHVLKVGAGWIVTLTVTDTAAEYILVMPTATVPADGPVPLLFPPIKVAANTTTMIIFQAPISFAAGVSVCNSSTGTFTKTIGGATCIFTGQVR
jgi:hypothetical protein